MLGYNNSPNREPAYDYYLETDLDTFDEPVDYSTKYKEQDGYKDNRATNFKVRSSDIGSQSTKGINCSDEVKVYCLHSSPLTISPASSLSDLPIASSSNDQLPNSNCHPEKNSEEKYLPETNDDCIESESIKVSSACESKKDSPLNDSPKSKVNSRKEKSVTFGGSSVTETPLMFSRSSSVDSLSSFEQQLIIDDRSYVSAISTPASGMISPSELPASPSELMPSSNPKSKPAFQFPVAKNCNSKNLTISIDFKLKECDVVCNGVFDDSQKVFCEEGKFSTTSSLSALSFGDGSTRVSVSLFDDKRNSILTGKSSSNASDDEAPSYVFNDTKREYRYEGQLVASNNSKVYKPPALCPNQPNLQAVFRTYLPDEEQQECPPPLSYVFEDTKNVYNDEGKFSTTSSLSSISFHDHVESSPAMFQSQYSLSSLVNGFKHPVANSKDLDSKEIQINNECCKLNDTGSDSDTGLNGDSPLEQDMKLHTSWSENSPPASDSCSKQLLMQPNEVLNVNGEINDSEESEYDSEQEREDQLLIKQLLQPTIKLDISSVISCSGNMLEIPPRTKEEIASSKNLSAKNKSKSKCDTAKLNSLHRRQESSPAQTDSSESEYDSDQERKDEAIIEELLSGSKALQKSALDHFKSLSAPKPRTSAPPNIFTVKALRTPRHVQEKMFLKQQEFNSHVQESSESEYDSEQERKDQEEIQKLMQYPMLNPKHQPLDDESGGLQSSSSTQVQPKRSVDAQTQCYEAHYMRCPPVELYEVSSESEYDSEQEREDEELISRLLSQRMQIQVPNTANVNPGVAFETCNPADFVDTPRNFCACNVPRPDCIGQQQHETEPPQKVQYEQEHSYARHYRGDFLEEK